MAARDQVRRLPDACKAGPGRGAAADPHRTRLDASSRGRSLRFRPGKPISTESCPGNGEALVFLLFDLLHLDGEAVSAKPVNERKERLRALLSGTTTPLQFSDHQTGRGRGFYEQACGMKLEGIVSKQADAPYAPGNRGLWLKVKCLNREEFVVVGWTDPEGARPSSAPCSLAITIRRAG
jgi:ATP-dependent DNA ligase